MQGEASVTDWDVIYPEKDYIFGDFTERLWAYLTIQQLLETRFEMMEASYGWNGFPKPHCSGYTF